LWDKLNAKNEEKKGTIHVKRIIVLLLCVSFLAACSRAPQNGASSSQEQSQNGIKVQQVAPTKREIKDPTAVADRLEKLAASIPRVESAHCVVFGNTAVVGINVSPDLDRSKIGTIKYSVAEALRKDPYGVNAIVTADMDLDQRLRDIRDNVKNGHPITGFAEQMADIIGRVMPQLPRDINNEPQEPTPQDAKQLGNQTR
jgi:YhcN/YlaJ family sporulation lipoprotein